VKKKIREVSFFFGVGMFCEEFTVMCCMLWVVLLKKYECVSW
jgi:hypothetical protein